MHCKNCDYPLWNLKARQCPECGKHFRPSEYQFVVNTVRFCCPFCNQAYYGTGPNGHLTPRQFLCVSCQRQIDMDDMVLVPAGGIPEARTQPPATPWIERKARGRIRSFLLTILWAMVAPGRLMRGLPPGAPVGDALAFGGILIGLIAIVSGAAPFLLYSIYQEEYIFFDDWSTIITFLLMSVAVLIAPIGLLLLWAMTAHLVLRMTGVRAHGLDRTLQAISYSTGANVVTAIPCLGIYFGWIWWLVSASIMLSEGQKVHPARAIIAVLALPLALLVTLGTASGIAWRWANDQGYVAGAGLDLRTGATASVAETLSFLPNPRGPMHAIELELSSPAEWRTLLCNPATKTTPQDVPVGATTLAAFREMSRDEQFRMVAEILAATPDNVVAHRLGDYVFVHHGADLSTYDPELWVVVMLPDPGVNGAPTPETEVHIGTNDGLVRRITFSQLGAEIAEQNEYRAVLELPALPDLAGVLHGQPALAPASEPDHP